ncbi:phenylalanine ammonia-lyase [Coniophora puteana RWD-64-598 SS2]|uniref:Phenylalanine ammonia-lyase n=1 Tax=Coniophora puteana (strain RWD-64-598) TaxID=741705 RepID=A0A5M3MNV2_CONPW|nr:phenylalanine ammonia-lyase [Coniophora puteana RWD-64-598 SS2]EIW80706.1 phenylalanine ammonia-lyase [Coniophora puteana RWD-64-598 SS2]
MTISLKQQRIATEVSTSSTPSVVDAYIQDVRESQLYANGKPVVLNGQSLTLPALAYAARRPRTRIALSADPSVRSGVEASRAVIQSKVDRNVSVYGVTTGFGGSADTRTDDAIALGAALLQHQHGGVILPNWRDSCSEDSSSEDADESDEPLPLNDPVSGTTMPESWVRGAVLVRMNSLIRGHSGVRWALIEKMGQLLIHNITPVVPLRGSISASGDLSSLSYIAGTLIGNPGIRVWSSQPCITSTSSNGLANGSKSAPKKRVTRSGRTILPSRKALEHYGIEPLPLASKEHLGILNGTAFSASVAAQAAQGLQSLAMLSIATTALATEALTGTAHSFVPFISQARPHPGQITAAATLHALLQGSSFATGTEQGAHAVEEEVKIADDAGLLRQDRYALRTAPQWLGPMLEDVAKVRETVRIEINSTTDNPLIEAHGPASPTSDGGKDEPVPGTVHHGGNFQALHMTTVMDHARLGLALLGKISFAQLTETVNATMNRGLPPNLAGGEPSLDYGFKGIDINAASYLGELHSLGGMNVGVGSVSAEMHNQSVNSLALVSARYTLQAYDVLSLLLASHLVVMCQAVDLRAIQREFSEHAARVIRSEVALTLSTAIASPVSEADINALSALLVYEIQDCLDKNSTMDTPARMSKAAGAGALPWVEFCASRPDLIVAAASFPALRSRLAARLARLSGELKCAYMGIPVDVLPRTTTTTSDLPASIASASRGPAPASVYLAPATRALYEFVRVDLGVRMHGSANIRGDVFGMRSGGLVGADVEGEGVEATHGDSISRVCEAIRDGRMDVVVAGMFEGAVAAASA